MQILKINMFLLWGMIVIFLAIKSLGVLGKEQIVASKQIFINISVLH